MKERPILFSAPMVRALLDGSKTQTRRIAKEFVGRDDLDAILRRFPNQNGCPYGKPGDRLWVRETYFAWGRWETRFSAKKGRDEWHFIDMTLECGESYLYAAYGVSDTKAFIKRRSSVTPMYWKRPAIFMPRATSRILLEVTGVRVERLQDISEADAKAEGTPCYVCGRAMDGLSEDDCHCFHAKAKPSDYRNLWEAINGAGSWAANPWVWVVEFRRVRP